MHNNTNLSHRSHEGGGIRTIILIMQDTTNNTPGLRYKIPVFSDPDPGKS